MDIKQLEYLIDIAELKSVTRAAEKNFMSQSTLSREVKILEKRIGVNLFVWDNREMRLTEEGILYLNGARELLQEYKKGMQALERLKAKQHQVIHLILSPKVQYFFRSHIQPEFVRQFPHTSLEVTVGSVSMAEEYLEHGFADLAITATHTPEKFQSENPSSSGSLFSGTSRKPSCCFCYPKSNIFVHYARSDPFSADQRKQCFSENGTGRSFLQSFFPFNHLRG